MRTLLYTIIGLFLFNVSYSQDISRSAITTAGGYVTNNDGISVSWSMGQVFSLTTQSEQHLTEGFQQGKLEKTGKVVLSGTRKNSEEIILNLKKSGNFNTKYFIIQRRDATEETFLTIGTVSNIDSETLTYTDYNNSEKDTEYRIQYFNYGTKKFTNTATIEGSPRTILITVFPNPTVEQLNIELSEKMDEEIIINIWTVEGQNVFSNTYQNIDNQIITISDLSNLANGNYLIQISNKTEIIDTKSFVKI